MGGDLCTMCGREYTFPEGGQQICPWCMGYGEKDKKCTCPSMITMGGLAVNFFLGWDESCPIHPKDPRGLK